MVITKVRIIEEIFKNQTKKRNHADKNWIMERQLMYKKRIANYGKCVQNTKADVKKNGNLLH